MQDVADRAGVSRAAVSLALRNHASIPLQTRARIQRLAEEMGYRKNPLVSALMTYQRNFKAAKPAGMTLAFVSRFSSGDAWRAYLSPDLITRAEQTTTENSK
jgi:DNA-binding LacI/PurR family transcriptional regulator